jgi:uncharacterized membrane protein (DUF2068 family)
MTTFSTQIARTRKRHDKGLMLIAAYKFLIALLFTAVGFGALRLIGKDVDNLLANLVSDLHFPESRFINFLIDKASMIDDHMLRRIGAGAFIYAGLGFIEAIGLYLEKGWAEYFTLAITASFLPFEIREIIHRLTWMRVGVFVINVAVLIYLIVIVFERHHKKRLTVATSGK